MEGTQTSRRAGARLGYVLRKRQVYFLHPDARVDIGNAAPKADAAGTRGLITSKQRLFFPAVMVALVCAGNVLRAEYPLEGLSRGSGQLALFASQADQYRQREQAGGRLELSDRG